MSGNELWKEMERRRAEDFRKAQENAMRGRGAMQANEPKQWPHDKMIICADPFCGLCSSRSSKASIMFTHSEALEGCVKGTGGITPPRTFTREEVLAVLRARRAMTNATVSSDDARRIELADLIHIFERME